jgi:hypothetical protein
MVQPIQRVNVDVTAGMLEELDKGSAGTTREAPGSGPMARKASVVIEKYDHGFYEAMEL